MQVHRHILWWSLRRGSTLLCCPCLDSCTGIQMMERDTPQATKGVKSIVCKWRRAWVGVLRSNNDCVVWAAFTTLVHSNGSRILRSSPHKGVQAMHIILIETHRAWTFPGQRMFRSIVSQDHSTRVTVVALISSTISEMCIYHVHCNNKVKSTIMSHIPLMSSCYHCAVSNITLSSTCKYTVVGYSLLCLLPSWSTWSACQWIPVSCNGIITFHGPNAFIQACVKARHMMCRPFQRNQPAGFARTCTGCLQRKWGQAIQLTCNDTG